jgi:hypothetical protein
MAISTQALYDWKRSKHGVAANSDAFRMAFDYALSRIKEDLVSPAVGLDDFDVPGDLSEDIEIDGKYFGVVSDGIDRYLSETGQWGMENYEVIYARYDKALARAHTLLMTDTDVHTRMWGSDA